ncbi:MAG: hypothetical protein ACI81W_000102 [Saprospiraceae bacterium]|jgi:hypothetical protein
MKWLKRLGVLLLVLIAVLAVLFFIYNEPRPEGQKSTEADALANQMLKAIDKAGWDSTTYVQWTFKGMHSFLWDKDRNFVEVNWGDNRVLLNTKKVTGKAFVKGVEEIGPSAEKLIQDAWSFFCNDSFWLNAPAKAFDPGTERSIVTQEDGSKGLMVSYTSGGVTPGDAYLWILDEKFLPKTWKMWVKIIPVGGMEFSWDQWETLSTGAKVATFHKSSVLDLDISELKGAISLEGLGLSEDPFGVLE